MFEVVTSATKTVIGARVKNLLRVVIENGRTAALPEIAAELGHVAEGVPAAREVARRAAELGVDMPITRAVTAVLDGSISPRAAVEQLMARGAKHE